jgi:Domain of unknown function (DUF2019)
LKVAVAVIEEEFARLAIEHQGLMNACDSKAANKVQSRFSKHARAVRELPDRGASLLLKLINHTNSAVRAKAAYLLLPINERLAIQTLRPIAKSESPWESTNAEMIIKEWKAGELDVDWFMKDETKRKT